MLKGPKKNKMLIPDNMERKHQKDYFCVLCACRHYYDSNLGKDHKQYARTKG